MNLLLLFSPVILFISGAYDLVKIKNTWNFYKKILVSALVWLVTGVLYFYLNPDLKIAPKTILLLTTIVGFSLIALWRYFHSRYVAQIIKKTTVIFLGATPETEELALIINKEPERGYQLTGIFNPSHTLLSTELARYTIQNSQELKNKMNSETIGLIVISPDLSREDALLGIMYENLFKQVELVSLAEFYERIMERIPPFTFSESWFLTNLREQQKKMYDRFRILIDYVTAALLSIVGLVTLPFVALLIKSTSRGPVFYHQLRIGQHGRTFRIYKYRTMKVLSADGRRMRRRRGGGRSLV
jgi:hypothetical protein